MRSVDIKDWGKGVMNSWSENTKVVALQKDWIMGRKILKVRGSITWRRILWISFLDRPEKKSKLAKVIKWNVKFYCIITFLRPLNVQTWLLRSFCHVIDSLNIHYLLMEKIFISKLSFLIITVLHFQHAFRDGSLCHFLQTSFKLCYRVRTQKLSFSNMLVFIIPLRLNWPRRWGSSLRCPKSSGSSTAGLREDCGTRRRRRSTPFTEPTG